MSPSPVAIRERPGLPFFCPLCQERRSTEATLVGHLIDGHGFTAREAGDRAASVARDVADRRHHPRAVPPPTTEETTDAEEAKGPTPETGTMSGPRKCGTCGKPGHRADRCPAGRERREACGGGKSAPAAVGKGDDLTHRLRAAANDYEKKAALLRETAETLEGA